MGWALALNYLHSTELDETMKMAIFAVAMIWYRQIVNAAIPVNVVVKKEE